MKRYLRAPVDPCIAPMNRNSDVSGTSLNRLFDKYEIGKLLGCGSFAKVYRARNINTGQNVAIKIINKKKIIGTALMSNIQREISIMRRLRHPNIVKLYEVLATKSKIYFVMELVKGGELFDQIAKGKFTEDVSRKYFHQLISAVRYCHYRGVYHRDLKPENLLIDDNGDLKISDFGLSAVTGQVHKDGLLHTLCGTPAYVAPEVLSNKGYDGEKVDIWSCGVILFVLTAGFLPFNDSNVMVMYRKIYKADFRCPKWISTDLRHLLSRLLESNPSNRITIDEMIHDPWFAKDFVEINFLDDDDSDVDENDVIEEVSTLNAFDIISFSSGLNLAGLFNEESSNDDERLVVEEQPEKVIEKVQEVAKEELVRLKRKRDGILDVEGENGDFAMGLEVYRLTDNLAVVEVTRKTGVDGMHNDLWAKKFKPEILGRREIHVSGD